MAASTNNLTAQDILQAARRLNQAGYVYRTPLDYCEPVSNRIPIHLYHKLELFQRTGSFKLRGATNKLLKLKETNPKAFERGFVTASAGNHALGLSYAARELKASATLVVPETISSAKLEALQRFPVEIVIVEGNYDLAESQARQLERERGLVFVSAYNDPEVAAGQGTLAMETLADLPEADILLVPVGGGGLLGGVALWAKNVSPRIKVIGVQSEASAAMYQSWQSGRLVEAPELPSLADGLAGNIEAGAITFELVQNYVDEIIVVSEQAIAQAIAFYARELHLIVEGSSAVGLAALLSDKLDYKKFGMSDRPKIVDFLTGRNISASRLQQILMSHS
jgi:threonine dehydratase